MYLLSKAMPKGKGRDSAVENSQLFVPISKLAACTVEAVQGADSFWKKTYYSGFMMAVDICSQ